MVLRGGINQASQKENNLAQVIRAIHSTDPCSRVMLTEITGLKQATITKIVNQLISWGLVSETESLESAMGRRPIRLMLNGENYLLMAVRINRDYLRVAVYDILSKVYRMKECPINALYGARASMNLLKDMVKDAQEAFGSRILAAGVALPGPFDARNMRISLMSGFPGWNEIDIREELQAILGIPVFLDHDANCGALAELWYGGHGDVSNLMYIAGDRGVGAGLILNGQTYRGALGYAGEIGHTSINLYGPVCECGNHGCLELYGSTSALETEYRREVYDLREGGMPPEAVSARTICQLVRAGDPVACRVYARTVSYLAFGVVSVINTINPDIVIFADKIIDGGELFLLTVREVLGKYLMRDVYQNLIVKMSALGGDPMLLGASVLAFEQLLNQPTAAFSGGQAAES